MLGKLIKYEFKATKRIMLPILFILLAFSISMAFIMHAGNSANESHINIGTNTFGLLLDGNTVFLSILSGIIVIGYGIFNMVAVTFIFFYAIVRFQSNLLGDEGYLMNTLPVSADQNIWSKGIVSVIWTLISFFAVAAAFLITCTGINGFRIFNEVIDIIKLADLRIFIIILLVLTALFNGYFCIYACIAIGYSFNKHRMAVSVISFLFLNTAEQILISAAAFLMQKTGVTIDTNIYMFLWFSILYFIISGGIYYIITRFFMTKRLNLQ